jgi:hypothetical protein
MPGNSASARDQEKASHGGLGYPTRAWLRGTKLARRTIITNATSQGTSEKAGCEVWLATEINVRALEPAARWPQQVAVACRDQEEALPDAWWGTRICGPKGSRNGNYKHGRYTAEAIASRRWLRHFTRDVRALTKRLRNASVASSLLRSVNLKQHQRLRDPSSGCRRVSQASQAASGLIV